MVRKPLLKIPGREMSPNLSYPGVGVRAPGFTSILVVSLHPSLCLPHPGLVSSDKASASYLLSHPEGGQVAVLAVGGPLEALEAKPGTVSLRLRNQKGFIKLSLEHG